MEFIECETCGDFVEQKLFEKHNQVHHSVKRELEKQPANNPIITQGTPLGSLLDMKDLGNYVPLALYTNQPLKLYQGKNFRCALCGKRFHTEEGVDEHLRKAHDNRDLLNPHFVVPARKNSKCYLCGKTFYDEERVDYHLRKIHANIPNSKNYICDHCGGNFFTKAHLEWHFAKYHVEQQFRRCVFIGCAKSYRVKYDLKRHMETHSVQDVIDYCSIVNRSVNVDLAPTPLSGKCPICVLTFTDLPKHHERQHLGKNKCEECGRGFSKRDALRQHMINCHFELNIYKCVFKYCEKVFSKEEWLKQHLAKHSEQDIIDYCNDIEPEQKALAIKCPICDSSFEDLPSHFVSVHIIKKYKCDRCGIRYSTKKYLLQHKQVVHDGIKPYKCDFKGCCKVYGAKEQLRQHRATHNWIYDCELCSRLFPTLEKLKLHEDEGNCNENLHSDDEESQDPRDSKGKSSGEAGSEETSSTNCDDGSKMLTEPLPLEVKIETFSDDELDITKMEPQSAVEIKPEPEEHPVTIKPEPEELPVTIKSEPEALPVTSFVPPEDVPNCDVKNEPEIEIIDDIRLQRESVASSISADWKKSLPGSSEEFQMPTCTECGRVFISKTMLDRHFALFHEKPVDHQCPKCPKTFELKFDLDRHCQESHS